MAWVHRLRRGWLWPGVLALALMAAGCLGQAQSGGMTSVEEGPAAPMEDPVGDAGGMEDLPEEETSLEQPNGAVAP